jgi:hypothetical protein
MVYCHLRCGYSKYVLFEGSRRPYVLSTYFVAFRPSSDPSTSATILLPIHSHASEKPLPSVSSIVFRFSYDIHRRAVLP